MDTILSPRNTYVVSCYFRSLEHWSNSCKKKKKKTLQGCLKVSFNSEIHIWQERGESCFPLNLPLEILFVLNYFHCMILVTKSAEVKS